MAQVWEVVGGAEYGGILVRVGRELSSPPAEMRLSTGALVQEEELIGNRLQYRRLQGTGPDIGWVSITLKEKVLVAKTSKRPQDTSGSQAKFGAKPPLPHDVVHAGVQVQRAPAECGFGLAAQEDKDSREEPHQLVRLRQLIAALDRPVSVILSTCADIERGVGNPAAAQARLTEHQERLAGALEEVRAAAEEWDPNPCPPPRAFLRCATPGCSFRVHAMDRIGGYCCPGCQKSGKENHGPRCERSRAAAGAKTADRSHRPMDADQLYQHELDEAIRLVKVHVGPKPKAGPEHSCLVMEPKWSRSGKDAIGKWVSSIIDDKFGNPDNSGPQQLLEGSMWSSKRYKTTNQWMVFDLGKPATVMEVRVRGHYVNTAWNPKRMQFQSGDGLDGPWSTAVSFMGRQDHRWVITPVNPHVRSRWWRLYIQSNWGGADYIWIHGFAIRQLWKEGEDDKKDGDPKGATDTDDHTNKDDDSWKDSDAHKTWNNKDLRKNDADWQQLYGYQKLTIHALLYDRVLFFEDKLFIDYKWHDVREYAKRFLAQPQEMGWSLDFHPNHFCELAYEGFNPTSIEIPSDNDVMIQVLTPCFEPERNVLKCLDTHISKKARKRSKNFTMTVDAAYDDVILGCIRQHGEGWLYRGERWVLRKLRQDGYTGDRDVRFMAHSFELWNEKGELVAGDLGYTMGGVYVSQTGFHKDGTNGAGEVQLVLTSALLHKMGHTWFDLGQARQYKSKMLGAETLDRKTWLEQFREARDQHCKFTHDPIDGNSLLGYLLQAMEERDEKQAETPHLLKAPSAVQKTQGDLGLPTNAQCDPYPRCTHAQSESNGYAHLDGVQKQVKSPHAGELQTFILHRDNATCQGADHTTEAPTSDSHDLTQQTSVDSQSEDRPTQHEDGSHKNHSEKITKQASLSGAVVSDVEGVCYLYKVATDDACRVSTQIQQSNGESHPYGGQPRRDKEYDLKQSSKTEPAENKSEAIRFELNTLPNEKDGKLSCSTVTLSGSSIDHVKNGPSSETGQQNRRVWVVIGGKETGGIIVRAGESLQSTKLALRLAPGCRIEEVEVIRNRMCYRRLDGEGPEQGWVNMSFNQKMLVALTTKTQSSSEEVIPPPPPPPDVPQPSPQQRGIVRGRIWVVVGGTEVGGIIVREGDGLESVKLSDRLATGAKVEELNLLGKRLHYRRCEGKGPDSGWVNIEIKGKVLMEEVPE